MPSCLLRFSHVGKAATLISFCSAGSGGSSICSGFLVKTVFYRFRKMAGEPPPKKVSAAKTIGTHNGTFHCDEALACFLLKQLPAYEDASIIRSRDNEVLSTCDIVVDVGGVYDPATNRFDHHQRTFSETMQSLDKSKKWTTKLSSAGLVYAHFGRDVIARTLGWKLDDPNVEKIYDKVYENFMEEIDAIDNGVKMFDEEPRYRISTNLSARVSHLNPPWNEPNPNPDEMFKKAVKLTGEEFLDRVRSYATIWMPARDLVRAAIQQRQKVDELGSIVVFSGGCCPWKEHLLELEEELGVAGEVKFVLYEDENKSWRVQGVPPTIGSFDCRRVFHPSPLVFLPKKWCGLRDKELSDVSGIEGCIFVHSNGFIGGNKTREGALEMALRTLRGVE
ncbi:unnamed protein product [Ixodes hexagonus]